jgi:hypothetical protein
MDVHELEAIMQQTMAQLRDFSTKFDKMVAHYEERIDAQFELTDVMVEHMKHAITILHRVAPPEERDLVGLLETGIEGYKGARAREQKRSNEVKAILKRSSQEGT